MSLTGPHGTPAARRRSSQTAEVPVEQHRRELGDARLAMRAPRGHRREARVAGHPAQAELGAQQIEELVLGTGDHDPAVGGGEVLERDDRRMGGARHALRLPAPREVPRRHVHVEIHGRLEQGDVAVAADAVAPRAPQAAHEGQCGGVARRHVDEREPGLDGRAVGLAGERHPAGVALQDVVVAALGCARTGHPEPRERAAHDGRIDALEIGVADTQLLGTVAAQVAVDGIRGAHEILEDGARARVREVERDAALVVAEGLEEERVLALLEGRHVAADVAARARVLDLDHVGAEIGELHAAPRTRAVLLDRDDRDVLERRAPHAAARRRRYSIQASAVVTSA